MPAILSRTHIPPFQPPLRRDITGWRYAVKLSLRLILIDTVSYKGDDAYQKIVNK